MSSHRIVLALLVIGLHAVPREASSGAWLGLSPGVGIPTGGVGVKTGPEVALTCDAFASPATPITLGGEVGTGWYQGDRGLEGRLAGPGAMIPVNYRLHVIPVRLHMRYLLARVRAAPYASLGLGVWRINESLFGFQEIRTSPATSLGLGMGFHPGHHASLGLEAAYEFVHFTPRTQTRSLEMIGLRGTVAYAVGSP
jgi:outer membrane protein with beta-barrel domain